MASISSRIIRRKCTICRLISSHPLCSRDRVGAAVRWLWLRAKQRGASPIIVHYGEGARLYLHPGATTVAKNYICGLRDYQEMALVLHLLRPGDLFLDVGANVGSYSVLAGFCVGAKVIAVEPAPKTYDRLASNIRLNGLEGVVSVIRTGVAEKGGVLRFEVNQDTINHVVPDSDLRANSLPIEVTTVDAICGGRLPVLLKLDVEGYELPALRGAPATIADASLKAIIVEANRSGRRYGFAETDVDTLLKEAGFSTYDYDPRTRQLSKCEAQSARDNVIYIRDLQYVEDRVRSARRFTVLNTLL